MSDSPLTEKLQTQRQAILKVAQTYGAYNLRVFGSVARGEDNDASDLDRLVDLEPGRSLFDLGGLVMDLQELLGCKIDVVTENGLKQRIRVRAAKALPSSRSTGSGQAVKMNRWQNLG